MALGDCVGLALLTVLDSLRPDERLAFVLHDVFAVPFAEIGTILGTSADATKTLTSRARRKVQAAQQPASAGRQRREMFRLVRGTGHILDVLHADRLALRIHDGAFSAVDLTARHPRTGELVSTVKFMVQTLAAGELQRDLQRELTYDGLRAAEAKGSKGGRRPAVPARKTDAVRTPYLEGRSIAALAREHGVSRGAIRTAVADLMPEHTAADEDSLAPELPVTLDMPGKVADFLRATELKPAERAALDHGVTVRRGQGC
ncbi:sigma factor-like helix-turn-helix DNA-binding protein [Streptomyces axinellae]|uniref:RNA polymerase sigma factor 70 region 4 type 2 domain-containing protein n=1 Tax=Streptomyces axinellae TaxID=552788 RepID=A0ABP6CRK9_9ACTN